MNIDYISGMKELTPAQLSVWFGCMLEKDSTVYNVGEAVEIFGDIHVDMFMQALDHIVNTTDTMHLRFVDTLSGPRQVIDPNITWRNNYIDAHHYPNPEQYVFDWVEKGMEKKVELAQGPLFNMTLFKLSDNHYLLYIFSHHLCLDGFGGGLLTRRISEAYTAILNGHMLEKELTPWYACVDSENDYRKSKTFIKDRDYWLQQLVDYPQPVTISGRSPGHPGPVGHACRLIPRKLVNRLVKQLQPYQLTFPQFLTAISAVFVHKLTGENDFILGIPVTGRIGAKMRATQGLMTNILPLRVQLGPHDSFVDLLYQVKHKMRELLRHQRFRREDLRDALGLDPEHPELYGTVVNINAFDYDLKFDGHPCRIHNVGNRPVNDLQFVVFDYQNGDDVQFKLFGKTGHYSQTEIDQLADHYLWLLELFESSGLEHSIDEVSLLSHVEANRELYTYNQTDYPIPTVCLNELFESQAMRNGTAVALTGRFIHEHELSRVTYYQLNCYANQMANCLIEHGILPGMIVGVCMERSIDLVITLLGILKAGAAYVPMEPDLPEGRIAFIYQDTGARLIVTDKASGFQDQSISFLQAGIEHIVDYSVDACGAFTHPDMLAYIIYTSGSTGQPKGVAVRHHSAVNLIQWVNERYQVAHDDRLLFVTSSSFDLSVYDIFGTLAAGARLYVASKEETREPARLLDIIFEQKITFWDSAPAFIQLLLPLLPDYINRPNHLRLAFFSGDWVPLTLSDSLHQCFPSVQVVALGGATEATIWSNWHDVTDIQPEWSSIPYGLPIHNAQYYVLDKYLQPLPSGVAGDLYIGGQCLADGYFRRPALTAERFVPDPFSGRPGGRLYHTGDRVKRMPDGQLEFLGRDDAQVKVRGYRIELGEIQACLLSYDGIEQAIAIIRDDCGGGGCLVAYLVAQEHSSLDLDAIRRFLSAQLPEYMIPGRFVVMDSFPVTVNGKLDRKQLPKPDDNVSTYQAPETNTERLIHQMFMTLLKQETVGIDDNFFSSGGDSLLAAQLLARLRKHFGEQLLMGIIFEQPTIRGLARFIDQLASQSEGNPVPNMDTAVSAMPLDQIITEAPLSIAQQRLWFIHQLQNGSCEYHIPQAIRMKGQLHTGDLQAAIRDVTACYDALRVCITDDGTQVIQKVIDSFDLKIPLIDLRQLTLAQQEEKIAQLLQNEWEQPFDFGKGPLFRAGLIRVGCYEHILLLTCHHLIADGWSMVMLRDAIFECYQRRQKLPVHDEYSVNNAHNPRYLEYALQEHQADLRQGASSRYAQELSYWQQQLEGIPTELALARDHKRPSDEDYQGHVLEQTMTPEQYKKLSGYCATMPGITPHMILLSSFAILLARYSGEQDIVIGTPVANRQTEQQEKTFGLFVSTLPLRIRLTEQLTFHELLEQVRETCLAAYQHQNVSFDRIVEALSIERNLQVTPVFQVMLAMQNTPDPQVEFQSLTTESITLDTPKTRFDLELHVVPCGDSLKLHWLYKTSLFKQERVTDWMTGFERLIGQLLDFPEKPVIACELLSPEQIHAEIYTYNQTRKPADSVSMVSLFEQQVQRCGLSLAIQGPQLREPQMIQLSYEQLNQRANQLAHYLIRQQIQPGDRVGLCMERSVELIIAMLAVLKVGAAYVPMEPEWPDNRRDFILQDTGCTLVITQLSLRDRFKPEVSCLLCDQISLFTMPVSNPDRSVTSTHLAYIIFTSGSTGTPKGVAMQHGPVCNLIRWVNQTYQLSSDDHLLFVTSPCFDLSVYDIFGILSAGARLTITGKEELKDPARLLEMLSQYQITFWDSAPAFIQQLLPLFPKDGVISSNLRLAFFSGDWIPLALPGTLKAAFPEIQVVGLGGATEAAIWSNFFEVEAVPEHWASIPYGLPIANSQYYILDAFLRPVPQGVTGDLYISGECLSCGYFNRPALTAESFIPDPYSEVSGQRMYRTGDRARRMSDGNIEFQGRSDHQVKVRGYRIETGEIQAALLNHPMVSQAVVSVRHDGPSGNYLVVYLIPEGNAEDVTAEVLQTYLGQQMPDYMVPSVFVVLEQFPLTANGKLDLKALPEPVSNQLAYQAPETDEQKLFCQFFSELLNVNQVGIHDSFFALGGDSIVSIMLVQKARQASLVIEVKDIFQQQTPARIAAVAKPLVEHSLLEPLPAYDIGSGCSSREVPLTPMMYWLFEREVSFNAFCQSVLITLPDMCDVKDVNTHVQQMLTGLMYQHPMLRLKTFRDESGQWVPEICEEVPCPEHWFCDESLMGLTDTDRETYLKQAAALLQERLAPEQGRMLQAMVIQEKHQAKLLLCIHHLAVDGISWHIITSDLAKAWHNQKTGALLPEAPTTGASFIRWSHSLSRLAHSPSVESQLDFWQSVARKSHRCLSLMKAETERMDSDASPIQHLRLCLPPSVDFHLVTEIATAFNARPEELFIAMMTLAINLYAAQRDHQVSPVRLDIESHGRFAHDSGDAMSMELARTVGWHTAIYPVVLDPVSLDYQAILQNTAVLSRFIKAVKEQLRAVPVFRSGTDSHAAEGRGLGYGLLRYLNTNIDPTQLHMPDAEIAFNYLGQVHTRSGASWELDTEAMTVLQEVNVEGYQLHPLSINIYVRSMAEYSEITADWLWSGSDIAAETVGEISGLWKQCMTVLATGYQDAISHSDLHMGGFTVSDFPRVQLTASCLDQLEQQYPALEDVLPLSPLQEGLLFHANFDQQQADYYTVQLGVEIAGHLNIAGLKQALSALIARHSALRAAFYQDSEVTCQVINQQVDLPWTAYDLTHLSVAEAHQQAEALRQQERGRRFELSHPPLLRVCIIHMPGASQPCHQVVISHHHLLMDGWSLAIFVKELFLLYQAQGNTTVLDVPPDYTGYIDWIYQQDMQSVTQWWEDYLSGLTGPTCLPDANESNLNSDWPARIEHSLPESLTEQLNHLARTLNVTLNSVLQGAWGLLMARLTDSRDIIFGITVSGRPAEVTGIGQMIGLFISALPFRIRCDPEQTVGDYLHMVHQTLAELTEHQHIGLSEVQKIAGQGTLFDSLIVLENYPLEEQVVREPAPGLAINQLFPDDATHYPINLIMTPGQQIHLRLQYNSGYISSDQAGYLIQGFSRLLESMSNGAELPAGCLSVMTPEEHWQAVYQYNQTAEPVPHCSLVDLVWQQVSQNPDRIAVKGHYLGGNDLQFLSYCELNGRANQVAHYLLEHGLRPGDHVGVCIPRSIDLIIAILGILKAGGAYVPVEPDLPSSRIAFIMQDTRSRFLFSEFDVAPEMENTTPIYWCRSLFDEYPPMNPDVVVDACFPAYVIFTSGSTGVPKGVALQHGPVVNTIHWVNRRYQINTEDRLLFVTSACFDLSVYDIFGSLAAGASIYVASPDEIAEPARLLEIIYRENITFWDSAPAFMLQMLPVLPDNSDRKSELRLAFFSGDWIPLNLPGQLKKAFDKVNVVSLGGATEAAIWSNWYDVGHIHPEWKSIPYGLPIHNARYYILDQDLRPVPLASSGDLYIGGACLAYGYYQRAALTAERFIPDPFIEGSSGRMYKTGDRARRMADGNIEFLGRVDNQVKVRGYRVETGEIEAALASHPRIDKALITIHEHLGVKQLLAYVSCPVASDLVSVSPDGDDTWDQQDHQTGYFEYLKTRLPHYMLPSAITEVQTWPLTANGKIDVKKLPKPHIRTNQYCPPESHQEYQLCHLFSQLLNIERIGIDDNFFELGGHSLLAAQLISKIEVTLGVKSTIRTLFESPTVRELAVSLQLESDDASVLDPIFPIRSRGEKAPLFCIHPIGGLSWCYSGLISGLAHDRPVYGIQAVDFSQNTVAPDSIESLAAQYITFIRQVQPHGPYHLLGWSLGGFIAHSIACQLQQEGEQTELLALMDCYPMDKGDSLPEWNEQEVLCGFAQAMEIDISDFHQGELTVEQFIHAAQKTGHVLGLLPIEQSPRLIRMIKDYRNMIPAYVPGQFVGDMLFFQAMESEKISIQRHKPVSAANWKPYVQGKIQTQFVACAHTEMSNQPYIKDIALHIEEFLQGGQSYQTE